ncbi:helix-hairpin-helix domain-containing protein [Streptococcus hillyeri]|uniref:ComEA family DNA-binding protein n=1 Tax=Streptococcus hillyeri TaxID=2282420 RepID=A0A3L9DUP9_9STRE|nr:helix-hairpin-helix domain-containing protein [Streptococcus hillyeri]RLY05216.1 ComEA family DNA-binding protein [Streptococcus hillyeri]
METIIEKVREHAILSGVGGGLLILVCIIGFLMLKPKEEAPAFPVVEEVTQVVTEKEEESSSAFSQESEKILVDVKGAVVSEGVYELSLGDRVRDAIELAGGLSPQADKQSVNFAQKLTDEAVVYVAKIGEVEHSAPAVAGDPQAASGKVNINKATAAELTTVSGIGEKRAQDIIAYREEHGKFSSLDDLTNVSGIGAKTLEKLKSELTID